VSHIRCQTCDEPWDTHHLRHDAIHETGLPAETCASWDGRLTPLIRSHFEGAAYRFGSTIHALKSCPCCPKGANGSSAGRRRGQLAELAAGLLGDDPDGLLTEVSDASA